MILLHNFYMLTDSLFSLLKVIVQCLYAFHVALCVMTMCHCVFVEYLWVCVSVKATGWLEDMDFKYFLITFIKKFDAYEYIHI